MKNQDEDFDKQKIDPKRTFNFQINQPQSQQIQQLIPQLPNPQQTQKLEYSDFMKDAPLPDMSQFQEDLKRNSIYYHPQYFSPKFLLKYVESEFNQKVVLCEITFSYFTMLIKIYNEDGTSRASKNFKLLGSGSFGSIYLCSHLDSKTEFVIKSLPFEKQREGESTMIKEIQVAIFQYCFYKLASALKIGPKVSNQLGFDLITYQQSVEFAIELCHKVSSLGTVSLKSSLKLLHSLHITHCDIKQDNIMYSPSYDKNILIDYNCGAIIRENIGQKTITYYKGTITYVCKQMQELFLKNVQGYVDLYYNDIYGLDKVIKNWNSYISKNANEQWNGKISRQNTAEGFMYCSHLNLRHLIYERNQKEIKEFTKKYRSFLLITEEMRNKAIQAQELGQEDDEFYLYSLKDSKLRIRTSKIIKQTINLIEQIAKENTDLGSYLYQFFGEEYHPVQNIYKKNKKKGKMAVQEKELEFEKEIRSQKYMTRFQQNLTENDLSILNKIHQSNILVSVLDLKSALVSPSIAKTYLTKINQENNPTQIFRLFFEFLRFNPPDQMVKKMLKVLTKSKKVIELNSDDSVVEQICKIEIKYRGEVIKCNRILSIMEAEDYIKYVEPSYTFLYSREQINKKAKTDSRFQTTFIAIDNGVQNLQNYIKIQEKAKIMSEPQLQNLRKFKFILNGILSHTISYQEAQTQIISSSVNKYKNVQILILDFLQLLEHPNSISIGQSFVHKINDIELRMKEMGVGKHIRLGLDIIKLRYYLRSKQISVSKRILQNIKKEPIVSQYYYSMSIFSSQIFIGIAENMGTLIRQFQIFEGICSNGVMYLHLLKNIMRLYNYIETAHQSFMKYLLKICLGLFLHLHEDVSPEKLVFFQEFYLLVYLIYTQHFLKATMNSIHIQPYFEKRYPLQNFPKAYFETLFVTLQLQNQRNKVIQLLQLSYDQYPDVIYPIRFNQLRLKIIYSLHYPKEKESPYLEKAIKFVESDVKNVAQIFFSANILQLFIKYSLRNGDLAFFQYVFKSLEKCIQSQIIEDKPRIMVEYFWFCVKNWVDILKNSALNPQKCYQIVQQFVDELKQYKGNSYLYFMSSVHILIEYIYLIPSTEMTQRNKDIMRELIKFMIARIKILPFCLKAQIIKNYYFYLYVCISENILEQIPHLKHFLNSQKKRQKMITKLKIKQFRSPYYKNFSCFHPFFREKVRAACKKRMFLKEIMPQKLRIYHLNKQKHYQILEQPFRNNVFLPFVATQKLSSQSPFHEQKVVHRFHKDALTNDEYINITKQTLFNIRITKMSEYKATLQFGFSLIHFSSDENRIDTIKYDGRCIYVNQILQPISEGLVKYYKHDFETNDLISVIIQGEGQANQMIKWKVNGVLMAEYTHAILNDKKIFRGFMFCNIYSLNRIEHQQKLFERQLKQAYNEFI